MYIFDRLITQRSQSGQRADNCASGLAAAGATDARLAGRTGAAGATGTGGVSGRVGRGTAATGGTLAGARGVAVPEGGRFDAGKAGASRSRANRIKSETDAASASAS